MKTANDLYKNASDAELAVIMRQALGSYLEYIEQGGDGVQALMPDTVGFSLMIEIEKHDPEPTLRVIQ